MKVHPIPHTNFETTRSGFIKILRSTKIAHLSEIFGLLGGWVKIHKFLMLYLKPHVSFSLNFASLFNVMRNESSVLFQLKLYMIFTKEAHQNAKF